MRFLGNKDSIVGQIKELLDSKQLSNRKLTLFDAFCGSGSVADALKDSFNLIVNDIMAWSVIYTRGRVCSAICSFDYLGFDPFEFLNFSRKKREGFIYKNCSPGGSKRMYFTPDNAARIDYFRWQIEKWYYNKLLTDNEYAFLIASLIESVSSVSNTAGVYGAFLKKWDSRALKPIVFQPVNAKEARCMQIDAVNDRVENIIGKIQCDVLYLDPPYTQNQYGTQYHLFETLVLDDNPKISPVTGSRSTSPYRSDWSKDFKAHILLDKIIAETNARHIVMSYSNDGLLSKDYIESVLKRYGRAETYTCKKINYKQYLNWKANEDETHFEYIFYIKKKPINEVVYEAPLNYVGSKAKLVLELRKLMPTNVNRVFDIFGGGFNAGINLASNQVFYNDSNFFVAWLIESFKKFDTYDYLKYIQKTIKRYNLALGGEEAYIKARSAYNELPLGKRDIRFLYTLILYGFQQQIRFNSYYEFNNPPGNRWFNDRVLEKMISFSRRIKELYCIFTQCVFQNILSMMQKGDFVYLDPPYRLTCGSYNDGKRGFGGWSIDHENALFAFIDALDKKGVTFLLSYVLENRATTNGNFLSWLQASNYKMIQVETAQGRYGKRKEILVKNYE